MYSIDKTDNYFEFYRDDSKYKSIALLVFIVIFSLFVSSIIFSILINFTNVIYALLIILVLLASNFALVYLFGMIYKSIYYFKIDYTTKILSLSIRQFFALKDYQVLIPFEKYTYDEKSETNKYSITYYSEINYLDEIYTLKTNWIDLEELDIICHELAKYSSNKILRPGRGKNSYKDIQEWKAKQEH